MNERTVRRAREVRRRARQYRRRREGRLNGALSVCSLLLLTGIGTLCRDAQTPGLALAAQGFGFASLFRKKDLIRGKRHGIIVRKTHLRLFLCALPRKRGLHKREGAGRV